MSLCSCISALDKLILSKQQATSSHRLCMHLKCTNCTAARGGGGRSVHSPVSPHSRTLIDSSLFHAFVLRYTRRHLDFTFIWIFDPLGFMPDVEDYGSYTAWLINVKEKLMVRKTCQIKILLLISILIYFIICKVLIVLLESLVKSRYLRTINVKVEIYFMFKVKCLMFTFIYVNNTTVVKSRSLIVLIINKQSLTIPHIIF